MEHLTITVKETRSCPHQGDPHDLGNIGGGPRPTGGGDAMDLYDASKWALNGLLYGWAKALREHRIRVNALCMGATDSYMLRSFHDFNPSDEEVSQWMRAEDNAEVLDRHPKRGCHRKERSKPSILHGAQSGFGIASTPNLCSGR